MNRIGTAQAGQADKTSRNKHGCETKVVGNKDPDNGANRHPESGGECEISYSLSPLCQRDYIHRNG